MPISEDKRKSKVIRVSHENLSKLEKWKGPRSDSWNKALEVALNSINTSPVYTLPSLIFPTQKEARQAALEIGAREGVDFEEIEQPVKIRKTK